MWTSTRIAWLAAALACPSAWASPSLELDTSAALLCLAPSQSQRGLPEYPFDAWKRELGGRVKVALDFRAVDRAPAVTVLERDGDESFAESVRSHVAQWRVPCLAEVGGSARLVYSFVFKPDHKRVVLEAPSDEADAQRRAMLACVRNVTGATRPSYSSRAERSQLRGRVDAELEFTSPDQPPKARLLAHRDARPLAGSTQAWVDGLRMPCHTGGAVRARYTFVFTLEGEPAFGFKPLSLTEYMGLVRGINRQRIAFDTRGMGCPFDLRLTYLQPQAPNRVVEADGIDPARAPLMQWLRETELEIPRQSEPAIYADEARITVPCIRIDFKPKE